MAQILIREIAPRERQEAHLAVRTLYGISLSAYLKKCLRELRTQARAKHPELFRSVALKDLPAVDRTIYRHLTEEGRRTINDLRLELGLSRARLRESLDRLQAAGYIDALGEARLGDKRGAKQRLYVSLDEK